MKKMSSNESAILHQFILKYNKHVESIDEDFKRVRNNFEILTKTVGYLMTTNEVLTDLICKSLPDMTPEDVIKLVEAKWIENVKKAQMPPKEVPSEPNELTADIPTSLKSTNY